MLSEALCLSGVHHVGLMQEAYEFISQRDWCMLLYRNTQEKETCAHQSRLVLKIPLSL